MRFAALLLVAATALTLALSASAAPLRWIGIGHSSGDYASVTATGRKQNAHMVYIRGYGRGLSGLASATCSRNGAAGSSNTTMRRMVAGRLYRVRLPFRGNCSVAASLNGHGEIWLQILAS